jgi:chaperonin GroEL
MKKTEAKYDAEAREGLKKGVDHVYNAVRHTLGARGRNVVYEQYGSPTVTNDGISIARKIVPEDPVEYLGAEMVKQASEETNYHAGDGTTSTVILAREIIQEGLRLIDEGKNPMILRREIEDAEQDALHILDALRRDDYNLLDVARISVENEEVAKMVTDVIEEVGADGIVLVEESPGTEIKVESVRGYAYPKGYVSPYMATQMNGEAVLEDVPIIIVEKGLSLNTELVGVAQALGEKGHKSLMIVAEKVEGELLQTIVLNKQKGTFTIVASGRPETAEELEDLAALVGAEAVTKVKDIKNITFEHCGIAKKVIVSPERTIIVGEENERMLGRIAQIEDAIKNSDERYGPIEDLKDRLARLKGGIAKIKVGAKTPAEQSYLKMKIDDAVGATKAALAEGVVEGAGMTFKRIAAQMLTTTDGAKVLAHALSRPYKQLLENAGIETTSGKAYNVYTGEVVEDLYKEGIIDPAKVVRCVVQHSVSTAKTLLTTSVVVVNLPESDSKAQSQS